MYCTKCPRKCQTEHGFCNADSASPEVASVYIHTGEEPPLCGRRGISNIFFAHCNLQCCYCQNHEISRATVDASRIGLRGVDQIVDATIRSLKQSENMVGFVSATQYSDLVPLIVERLHELGHYPTVVYNSNGYESLEVLKTIAPYIDIYLPDYKYAFPDIAARYSNAKDYPEVAGNAIKEMFNQKGSALATDEDGMAFRGIIIRHLVLPGQVENSLACLEWIAENISTNVHISLMSQYYPPSGLDLPDQLGRTLKQEEYDKVVDRFYSLGFHKGWVQDLCAAENYHPHFETETSFR